MDEVITAADGAVKNRAGSSLSQPSIMPSNLPLLSAFVAFAFAQFLKIFTTWFKEKRWDSRRMLSSGGMPSSHSATVTALAVAIGLHEGTAGPAFAIAVVLACVVMYDASGVRLHAGRQAELLNQIVCELPPEHPLSNVRPLHDSLGHTPVQGSKETRIPAFGALKLRRDFYIIVGAPTPIAHVSGANPLDKLHTFSV